MSLALATSVGPLAAVYGTPSLSPLMIADRLITLAREADRAGCRGTASHLVGLAYSVLDEGSPVN